MNSKPISIQNYTIPSSSSKSLSNNNLNLPKDLKLISEIFEKRPDLNKIKLQKEQNKYEQNLIQNQLLPKIDAQIYGSKDYGDGSKTRKEAELKAGLKIDIPLQQRANKGRLQFYESKQNELENLEQYAKEKINTELQDAVNTLKISLEREKIARTELKIAKQIEAGELVKLEHGDSNLIFLNIREQNSADATIRQVEAQVDFKKALANFQAISLSDQ